jgi:hypothetical protein
MCDSWCCRHMRSPKLVCFKHRFVAKGWSPRMETKAQRERMKHRTANCPTCQKPLEDVGSGAKVPPRRNAVAWRKFEAWFRAPVTRRTP